MPCPGRSEELSHIHGFMCESLVMLARIGKVSLSFLVCGWGQTVAPSPGHRRDSRTGPDIIDASVNNGHSPRPQ